MVIIARYTDCSILDEACGGKHKLVRFFSLASVRSIGSYFNRLLKVIMHRNHDSLIKQLLFKMQKKK